MPRYARVKTGEYCTYHIIERGNARKPIFFDANDKGRFLDTLRKMKQRYGYKLYAYCLMDNHVHLVIDSNGSDISTIMKSINVSYVFYFNKKYQRCGHLFQDRFRSEVVDSDRYLIELTRYIHLNPVRAKIVGNASDYKWSSYGSYIGLVRGYSDLLDISLVLKQFSNDVNEARKEYINYVGRNDDIIHDKDIEERIPIDYSDLEKGFFPEIKNSAWVQNLIEKVAQEHGILVSDIIEKRSEYIIPRNQAIAEVRKNTNLNLKEIGDLFGGLSESAVSRIIKKGCN